MSKKLNWACGSCEPKDPCNSCSTDCCRSSAKICHHTVETAADLAGYTNAFVYVRDECTTYHIDDNGNQLAVSKVPKFEDNFNAVQGAYFGVQVFDFANCIAYVYDYNGDVKQWSLT